MNKNAEWGRALLPCFGGVSYGRRDFCVYVMIQWLLHYVKWIRNCQSAFEVKVDKPNLIYWFRAFSRISYNHVSYTRNKNYSHFYMSYIRALPIRKSGMCVGKITT